MNALIRIEDWELDCSQSDGEPRARDIDLAERLGYGRPRDIRKLIDRLLIEQKLNDSDVRATVAQTSKKGGRPSTEYWLTEEQALYVVAKSETKEAHEQLLFVLRVFRLARKGLLGNTSALFAEFQRLRQEADEREARYNQRLEQLERKAGESKLLANGCDLRDNKRVCERAKSLISAIDKKYKCGFQKINGAIRVDFDVAGYRRIPLGIWPTLESWLVDAYENGAFLPAEKSQNDCQRTLRLAGGERS